ncbi:hypothetical protein [Oceanithermus sp.]
MRSFVNLHVRTDDAGAVSALAEELRTPGLVLYVVPADGWYSLYDERLEADEDREALIAALLRASRLGRAAAFMVLEDESLFWALAEGEKLIYSASSDPEGEERQGSPPADFQPAAIAAAEAGEPKTASVRALARMLGLEPDHAVVGFGDLLEMDEEGELPEEVWVLEDAAATGPQLFTDRPYLEEEHAGG